MGLTWIEVSLETTTITALLRMAEASKVRCPTGLRATPCSRRSESFGRHVPHAAHTSEIFMNEEMLRKSGAPSEPTCLPGRGARGTTHGIPVMETPTLHQPARSPRVPNQPDSEQFRSSAEHATS